MKKSKLFCLILLVCSQWPIRALVFELVAPPLEQISTESMHFNLMSENPYLTGGKVDFCSDSHATKLKKYGPLRTDYVSESIEC